MPFIKKKRFKIVRGGWRDKEYYKTRLYKAMRLLHKEYAIGFISWELGMSKDAVHDIIYKRNRKDKK
jgi:hypothetical protein